jgi:hypothetical protein
MSIKSKVFAAAATLTVVGGVGTAGVMSAGTAHAATPSCGYSCIDIFSRDFGNYSTPMFVMDTWRQTEAVGQPVILYRTSNSDPAEDFVIDDQGTVNDFYSVGLVTGALELHYAGDEAYEFEYAPYGVDSGLCVGTAAVAAQSTPVSLQGCGVSSKTVWVVDELDATISDYVPLINGSDTNFSHPFVLTYPADNYPTDTPRPQLMTQNITGFSRGGQFEVGTVDSNQLWSARYGTLK